jgi:hypothetical protein
MAYTAPRLSELVPDVQPTFPSTKLLNDTLNVMKTLMPEQWHEDGNFANNVEMLRRLIVWIAEEDSYYRMWLELFVSTLTFGAQTRIHEFAQEVPT